MGLPVAESSWSGRTRNDILTRFFETGAMTSNGVVPTLSPSMDIQISSNFERLLFEASNRDGAAVSRYMDQFKQSGSYTVDPAAHAKMLERDSRARGSMTRVF
jgi:threonine synthase